MILPDAYLEKVAEATHANGGIFVLDCIASGAVWVNMEGLGVDVLITAPQKGWSGPACMAMVALGQRALDRMGPLAEDQCGSFSLSLRKWREVMDAYMAGGHAYVPQESVVVEEAEL